MDQGGMEWGAGKSLLARCAGVVVVWAGCFAGVVDDEVGAGGFAGESACTWDQDELV